MTGLPNSGDHLDYSNNEVYQGDADRVIVGKSDLVAVLLGGSYHPGGLYLTRRMADIAFVEKYSYVLDVASGAGTTASLLATEFEAKVLGIDRGVEIVEKARAKAAELGIDTVVDFRVGDAEELPIRDSSVDVVMSECAFSMFPNKKRAAEEMVRVLKPGGRLALSDVVLDRDSVDERLRSLAGWVDCIAEAHSVNVYTDFLEKAGLEIDLVERHDFALSTMIDAMDARMTALKIVNKFPAALGLEKSERALREARETVSNGSVGYAIVFATKPKV